MWALLHERFTGDPCLSSLGTHGTHLSKLTKLKYSAHEKSNEKALQRGSITADTQGVSEDLVLEARGCSSPRLPHQNDDLVLGVCHSHKSPGQPCLRAKRHCWFLPLGLECVSLQEQWCCRCKLLWLCFDCETWYSRRLTHAHTEEVQLGGKLRNSCL